MVNSLETRAVPATYFAVSGVTAPTAGSPAMVTVEAKNNDGSTDTMYWSGVRFSSSDPWATLPGTSYLTNGVGTFPVTLYTAGAQSITAKGATTSSITGTQAGIAVSPATTAKFSITGFPASTAANIPHTVVVTAADAFGNRTPAYTGTVHFTSSDSLATLPADTALATGQGTFSLTLRTNGVQTFTATDTANPLITGDLANIPQVSPVFTQAPNPNGWHDKSAWYAPDGLDNDQYVWDNFTLASNTAINSLSWRGCYTNYLSGAGTSPVYDFTVSIWASTAMDTQPDVAGTPLVRYHTNNNANETPVGTFGGYVMNDYSFDLPTPFRAAAGRKYWVEIVASQGVTPFYGWPPDWSWSYAVGTGGHFRGTGGTGLYFTSMSGDMAYTLWNSGFAAGTTVIAPPAVANVTINSGQAQRSLVESITVDFNQPVTLPVNPAEAFQLSRMSDNAPVTLDAFVDGNSVVLTFTGGAVDGWSLADGRYALTVLAAKVNAGNFDGNNDGATGDNYVLASSAAPDPPTNVFRLFGDVSGDGYTDNIDFIQYRLANGSSAFDANYNPAFDANGDGFVDNVDFVAFRQRVGVVL